jgi:hypothetical protein
LEKNTTLEALRINLRLRVEWNQTPRFHLDTFDLYNARQRAAFVAAASSITGQDKAALEGDLAGLIDRLEEHQRRAVQKLLDVEQTPAIDPRAEAQALALLRDPELFERILADFEVAGTVGERENKLLGYLVAVSRKLDDPLSAIIMSRSSAGKSNLLQSILDFVPEEDKEVLTALTGQALFYLPRTA